MSETRRMAAWARRRAREHRNSALEVRALPYTSDWRERKHRAELAAFHHSEAARFGQIADRLSPRDAAVASWEEEGSLGW